VRVGCAVGCGPRCEEGLDHLAAEGEDVEPARPGQAVGLVVPAALEAQADLGERAVDGLVVGLGDQQQVVHLRELAEHHRHEVGERAGRQALAPGAGPDDVRVHVVLVGPDEVEVRVAGDLAVEGRHERHPLLGGVAGADHRGEAGPDVVGGAEPLDVDPEEVEVLGVGVGPVGHERVEVGGLQVPQHELMPVVFTLAVDHRRCLLLPSPSRELCSQRSASVRSLSVRSPG
jgi:hypothetical protein